MLISSFLCSPFRLVENTCRVQLLVESAQAGGLRKNIIDDEDAAFTAATLTHPDTTYTNFQPEYNLLVQERGHIFLK